MTRLRDASVRRRGLGVAIVLTSVLSSGATVISDAPAASASGTIPACGPTTQEPPSVPKHPNCYYKSYTVPSKDTAPVTAALTRVTRRWVPQTATSGYGHWLFVATISFHNPELVCHQPIPISALPCQDALAETWFVGISVPGKTKLLPMPEGFGVSVSTCNAANTTCTIDFADYPEMTYGVVRVVVLVSALDITPGAKNGFTGTEFPLIINIAHVKKPATI
jgi:hypothetical protein